MRSRDAFHRLQFQQDFFFNDYVCPKAFIKSDAIVSNGDLYLTFDSKARLLQPMRKKHFINRLQQTGTKLHMQLNGTIHDNLPNLIFCHSWWLRGFV